MLLILRALFVIKPLMLYIILAPFTAGINAIMPITTSCQVNDEESEVFIVEASLSLLIMWVIIA